MESAAGLMLDNLVEKDMLYVGNYLKSLHIIQGDIDKILSSWTCRWVLIMQIPYKMSIVVEYAQSSPLTPI